MFRNELYKWLNLGLTVSKEQGRERNICKQFEYGKNCKTIFISIIGKNLHVI